jgi:hypothetical protein
VTPKPLDGKLGKDDLPATLGRLRLLEANLDALLFGW